ncbi:unnamed protein product [Rotaria sordida]|uniref:Uncharacterized protein n=1 Tax=Rotaria sordida TaxID=392033 RepID=A0A815Q0E2_9BILA|nr:unnamed protein product [Rotaria sordida]CAF4137295.1 unnamed protein product [Rotaria sordida]
MFSAEESNYGKRGLGRIRRIRTYNVWILEVVADRVFKSILMMVMLVMLYVNELEIYLTQKSMKVGAYLFSVRLVYFCVLLICLSMMIICTTIKFVYMYLFAHGFLTVKRLVMIYSPVYDKVIDWIFMIVNAIMIVVLFKDISYVLFGFSVALVLGFIAGIWLLHETVVVMIPSKKTTSDVGMQTSVAITRITRRETLPRTTADLNV